MSIKRLQKELAEIQENSSSNISATPKDLLKLTAWTGKVSGPEGTKYEGQEVEVNIEIPLHYPLKAPTISLKSDSDLEENLKNIPFYLQKNWNPNLTIYQILAMIFSEMKGPEIKDKVSTNSEVRSCLKKNFDMISEKPKKVHWQTAA